MKLQDPLPIKSFEFCLKVLLECFEKEVDFGSSKETMCFDREEVDLSFVDEILVRGARAWASLAFPELDLYFLIFMLSF